VASPADREKWEEWLVPIREEVYHLHVNHHTFRRIRQIALENPAFGEKAALATNAFWPFLHHTFTHYAAAAVRRQCERNRQSISLARLLYEVAESPHFITRPDFMASVLLLVDRDGAEEFFDSFALGQGSAVDPMAVYDDIAKLEVASDQIVTYADKRVAHYDKGDYAVAVDLSAVEEPIDRLCDTLVRYHYLIRGERFDLGVPGVVDRHLEFLLRDPWTSAFQV
jgi:hypothetical protein